VRADAEQDADLHRHEGEELQVQEDDRDRPLDAARPPTGGCGEAAEIRRAVWTSCAEPFARSMRSREV
jgi:hypothetical protein